MSRNGSQLRATDPVARGCFIALFAAGVLYLVLGWGFGTWLLVGRWRSDAASRTCDEHLKALSEAMTMYLAHSGGVFPPASTWCDRLAPYVSDPRVFVCPSAPKLRCGYAFSAKLGGLRADSIPDPRQVIMLFESDRGWNATGGAELLPETPRHWTGDRYAFADGAFRHWLPRKRLRDKGGLRGTDHWTKEPDNPEIRWHPAIQ